MRTTTFAESQVETDVVGDILAKEDVSEDVTIDDAVQTDEITQEPDITEDISEDDATQTDETTQEPEITDSTILHAMILIVKQVSLL